MCGIAGYDFLDGTRTPGGLPDRILAGLRHRGPDGEGSTYFQRSLRGCERVPTPTAPVALFHTRLAIVDLSPAGVQPMTNEDGTIWLSLNGEIYNHHALRHRLSGAGHRFGSRSDAEVILHGYEEWGDDVVPRLLGMFAFALFDARADHWLCARDRFGIKPLVYHRSGDRFAFASDLNVLRLVPGVDTALDPRALAQYLALGYVPAPDTIVRGARKLERGHLLTVERGEVKNRRYAHPTPAAAITDREEAHHELKTAIRESVGDHLQADVPVACFLSGGTDSAVVCATARHLGARPRCYTVGFENPTYDERGPAQAVARHLDLPWSGEVATTDDCRQKLLAIGRVFDEPFADPSAVPTSLVATLSRREVKAVLSGDGGDELFLGYTRYRLFALAERSRRLPRPIKNAVALMAHRLPGRVIDGSYHHLARLVPLPPLRHPSRKLLAVAAALGTGSRTALYAETLRTTGRLLLESLRPGAESDALRALDRATPVGDLGPQLLGSLIDEATYLPEDILTKVDRCCMAVGLEARVPLLDPRVQSVARRIAPELHLEDGGKKVLKRVLRSTSPGIDLQGHKRGFSIPLAEWLRGPLTSLLDGLSSSAHLLDHGISRRGVERLVAEHRGEKADHGPALWTVICLDQHLRQHGAA